MSLLAWIVVGVTAWVLLSVVVALLIGQVVRRRDRQVPEPPPGTPVDRLGEGDVPSPRTSGENSVKRRSGASGSGGSTLG